MKNVKFVGIMSSGLEKNHKDHGPHVLCRVPKYDERTGKVAKHRACFDFEVLGNLEKGDSL